MEGTFYLFDCLDGMLGGRYWSLEELNEALKPSEPNTFTESTARRIAQNYEAELYRCTIEGGEVSESVCLYDPFNW